MILCSGEVYTEPIAYQTCLDCAIFTGNPPCGYSYPVLKAMFTHQEDRSNEIHVSDLDGCLRRAFWNKTRPIPEYVHMFLYRMIGIAVHAFIEEAVRDDPQVQAELKVTLGDIQGRADTLIGASLFDMKTTRWMDVSNLPYGNHELQVNMYAAMLPGVKSLYVQYIDLSGPSKCKRCKMVMTRQEGILACPNCGWTSRNAHLGAHVVEVPLHPQEETIERMQERRALLAEAMQGGALPAAEPSWLCRYCGHIQDCNEGLRFTGGRRNEEP